MKQNTAIETKGKILSEMTGAGRTAYAVTVACDGDIDIESLKLLRDYDLEKITREESLEALAVLDDEMETARE